MNDRAGGETDILRLTIKEFFEKGYLQEVNRRFFHPLGLSLFVNILADDEVELGGIYDLRDLPEGIILNYVNSYEDRINKHQKNAEFIDQEIKNRESIRKNLFGDIIEPIKGK